MRRSARRLLGAAGLSGVLLSWMIASLAAATAAERFAIPRSPERQESPQRAPITAATVPLMSAWMRAVRDHTPGRIDDALVWLTTMPVEQHPLFDGGLPLLLRAVTRKPLVVKAEAEVAIAEIGGLVADPAAFVHRAVLLHTDAAIEEGPGTIVASDSPAAAIQAGALLAARDGSYLGVIEPNRHWRIARMLLDQAEITPAPDPFVGDWYHATAAFMLLFSYFGELAPHLEHAEARLPADARVKFDLGVLWENRGLPRAQQLLSDEQLRRERFPPGRVRPAVAAPPIAVPALEVANRRAEAFYRRALDIDPKLAEARARLARLLSVRGRHRESRAEADAALVAGPSATTAFYAHLFAGRAAAIAGDAPSASQHFDGALALFPNAQSALLARSQAALMRGDDVAASSVVQALPGGADGGAPAADPWWYYHAGPGRETRQLLEALWLRVK